MRRKKLIGGIVLVVGLAVLGLLWWMVGPSPAQRAKDQIRYEFGRSQPDYRVIDRAFATLGREKYRVMAECLNDESSTISLGALDYMKTLKDPEAEIVLIGALESSQSGWAIARALGVRRSKNAVPQINEAIRGSEPGNPLRADAALALGQIDDPRGVAGLEAILKTARPPFGSWRKASAIRELDARSRAIGALFRIDPKNKIANRCYDELETYYEVGFGDMRPIVVAELAAIPRPEAEALIRRALTDPEPAVRATAVRALAKRKPHDLSEVLASFRKDPEPIVRAAAEGALAQRQN